MSAMQRASGLALLSAVTVCSASLFDILAGAPFLHAGTTFATDAFTYVGRACSYLEPENVTVAPAQGIGWTEGPSCPLLYKCPGNASTCAAACAARLPHAGFDRQGGDYRAFALPATVNGSACAAVCCAEAQCVAWVYTAAAPSGQAPTCLEGAPCCYLKATAAPETPGPGLFNGLVDRGPAPTVEPPPIGMRSAAPLGGVGAGAFELRGDGTIHEVRLRRGAPPGRHRVVQRIASTGGRATSPERHCPAHRVRAHVRLPLHVCTHLPTLTPRL